MTSTTTPRLTALVAAAALLGPVAAAEAHKVGPRTMREAATRVAKDIKRQTGAVKSEVTTCKRLFDHRGTCRVVSTYGGSSRCTTRIEIALEGKRARGAVGETLCS